MAPQAIDAITIEVIRNALLTTTSEMKNVVVRTAVSPLWKDAGDVSSGILTRASEMVAQGRGDIPVHMATMPFSLAGILERIPLDTIRAGDALIQNDPYSGGNTHLPDYLIAVPVFADGHIIGFSAIRGHWTDFYSATAREIYDEGLTIPPVKLYNAGQLNHDLVNIILANSRKPDDRLGDLQSQYAGCKVGAARIETIIQRYGRPAVEQAMTNIIAQSEQLTRAEIGRMPDGTYRFVDHLDNNGIEDRPIRIEVAVTISGTDIIVDFTGTAEQTPAGINNTYAATASAAYFVIKCVTDPWNPVNSGCYRPVTVVAPDGSLVNCKRPAPMAAYHETQIRICDALFGALAQAVPDRVPAAGYGSQGGLVIISGIDPRPERSGEPFILYEVSGGPSGATSRNDGLHGTRVGTGNTGNTPVESVEIHNPVMIDAYEIVPNTCGRGRFRGGCAVRRTYRVQATDAIVATIYERARYRPYGLFGGEPGSLAVVTRNPGNADECTLAAKSRPFQVSRGDVICVQTAGGGGYGPAAERDPERVRHDVQDGVIS